MRRFSLLVLLAVGLSAWAQNATVEKYSVVVECNSNKSMTMKKHLEVTINNKQAEDMADFSAYLERGHLSMSDFSGQVTDANGKTIKKIKKGDLTTSEYSSEFKTDGYGVYYSYTPSSFPVRIVYDWTLSFDKNIASFGQLSPLPGYDIDVKEATYQLTVPSDMAVLIHKENTDAEVTRETVGNKTIYSARMENLKAIKSEPLSPPFSDFDPTIAFIPRDFNLYGSTGSFESWKSLGQWEWQLADGRETIPADLAAKIDASVDRNASRDTQIRQVCKLMRGMTRYISIQLGIGGWQPEKSEVTARLGLGDCKALTTLLRGMLQHIGIDSYPTIVDVHEPRLYPDFASLTQGNHMLLCVPNEKDTLWVECTNLTLPIGFRHSGIAGHDAVVCTPEGGQFVTIPDNSAEENLWDTDITIDLAADGKAGIVLCQKAYGEQYESMQHLVHMEQAEQKKSILTNYNLGRIEEYKHFDVAEVEDTALITINIETTSSGYATNSGSRMMVPVNPMHKNHSQLRNTENRQLPVKTSLNYEDRESITINIPEGYAIETLPKPQMTESAVGTLKTTIEASERTVRITYDVKRTKQTLPAESYPEVQAFVKQVHNAYNQKIVLKKL